MRTLLIISASMIFAAASQAEQPIKPITDLSEFAQPGRSQIQWSNQRPEQQQALQQFYQSMGQTPGGNKAAPSFQRQQHIQQLRGMTPQQRQQLFLNYIQQNRR